MQELSETAKQFAATSELLTQLAIKSSETERSKKIKGHRPPRNWHYKNKR